MANEPTELFVWIADGEDSPMGIKIDGENFAAVTAKRKNAWWFRDLIKAKVSATSRPVRLYRFKMDGKAIETIEAAMEQEWDA